MTKSGCSNLVVQAYLTRSVVLLSLFTLGIPLVVFHIDNPPVSRSDAILLLLCFSPDVSIPPVSPVMCPPLGLSHFFNLCSFHSVAQVNTPLQRYERKSTDVRDNF